MRPRLSSSASSHAALFAAFAVCVAVLIFSWPDPHDRKRAVAPKLKDCCEVRIAGMVIVSRPKAEPEPVREAAAAPASLR